MHADAATAAAVENSSGAHIDLTFDGDGQRAAASPAAQQPDSSRQEAGATGNAAARQPSDQGPRIVAAATQLPVSGDAGNDAADAAEVALVGINHMR